MTDPELRELTASEPLTLEEEYEMQSEPPSMYYPLSPRTGACVESSDGDAPRGATPASRLNPEPAPLSAIIPPARTRPRL